MNKGRSKMFSNCKAILALISKLIKLSENLLFKSRRTIYIFKVTNMFYFCNESFPLLDSENIYYRTLKTHHHIFTFLANCICD